jgi:hypothetical protein
MPVTIEAIKSLLDDDLDRFIDSGMEEKRVRAERRKQETIARIKELAESVGVAVAIGRTRGRSRGGGKSKQAK